MPPRIRTLQTIIPHSKVLCAILSPRTGTYYATGGTDRMLKVWQVSNNVPRMQFGPLKSVVTCLRFNQLEDQLLFGTSDGEVNLVDIKGQTISYTWQAHKGQVTCVAFHPGEGLFVSGGSDGTAQILNIKSRRKAYQSYLVHRGPVRAIACLSNGSEVVTGGEDGNIRQIDLTCQDVISQLEFHSDAITDVQLFEDESVIASTSKDKTAFFYDTTTCQNYPIAKRDSSTVYAVRFANEMAVVVSNDFVKFIKWKTGEVETSVGLGVDIIHDVSVCDGIIRVLHSTDNSRTSITEISETPIKRKIGIMWTEEPRAIQTASTTRIKPMKPSEKKGTVESKSHSTERLARARFMAGMNEKYSTLIRIKDLLDNVGFKGTLKEAMSNETIAYDFLVVLRLKPGCIKFEDTPALIRVAGIVLSKSPELALATISFVMESFGQLAADSDELEIVNIEQEAQIESRRRTSTQLIESCQSIGKQLHILQTEVGPLSEAVAELVDQWPTFFK